MQAAAQQVFLKIKGRTFTKAYLSKE